jgi:hypothetical protein
MASNHMPDYTNVGNNVGRRIVTFRFDNVVSNPQGGLLKSICATELPNIVARCVGAYHAMCATLGDDGSFWKSVPTKMLEWQGKLAAATNKLHAFLEMDEDERGCRITFDEGHVTWLIDFKEAYVAAMKTPYVDDPAVFQRFGYVTSDKRWNCCKACKQIAKKDCCGVSTREDRLKKDLIFNMRLVRLGSVDTSSPMELRFKAALEAKLGVPFVKSRPAWLTNPVTGRCMELDMFNEALGIAVEYNGSQHYAFPNAFHDSEEEYRAQRGRDQAKEKICATRGVRLVSIRAREVVDMEIADFTEQSKHCIPACNP